MSIRNWLYIFIGGGFLIQAFWFWVNPHVFKSTWAQNPVIAYLVKEHQDVNQKSKLVTISYYYPNFQYWANIVAGIEKPKKEWMNGYYFSKPYIFYDYYKKVVTLLPEIDAGHYLFACCTYYSGNINEALTEFEKAINLNPYFFWSYYNAALIYFGNNDYLKSGQLMSQALAIRKEVVLEILHQDPFYRQIWQHVANPPDLLTINIQQAQVDAVVVMADCLLHASAFTQVLQVIEPVIRINRWHQDLLLKIKEKALIKSTRTDDIDLLIKNQITVRIF